MLPAALCFLVVTATSAGDAAPQAPAPAIVVLSATGAMRDGLPVVVPHPDAGRYTAVLLRGYAARVARLYAMAQRFVRPGDAPQPAYLVLTDNQGGFPRKGLFLDSARPGLAYVDLHRRSTLSGRPGAIDQIFPHELLHLVVAELAGEAPEGHATQVHAVGVRTDRVTAFNEGFAEHGQVMAIDDPGAEPATRALATDEALRAAAFARMTAYAAAVSARWSVAPRARMTFPLWFSSAEQVLRYHAVRANLFAYETPIPARLLTPSHAYQAYLLDNIVPGSAQGRPKTAARSLDTEGVVSALFVRLVRSRALRASAAPPDFYARFGAARNGIDDLDNAYLKIFAAIQRGGYDTASIVRACKALFPTDAAGVDTVVNDVLLGQPLPDAPEVWLLNEDFTAGTTVFDQFRGAPLAQAFDLNAASAADLAGVPGLDAAAIAAVLQGAPYGDVADLGRVPGMTPDRVARFQEMRDAMLRPPAPGTEREGSLSFRTILMPYAWRALEVWGVCGLIAAIAYRRVRHSRWRRAIPNGFAASVAALAAGWTSGALLVPVAAPMAIFGVPASLICLWKTRAARPALVTLLAWGLAALPAWLAVTPLG